jgi:hypothetical protein
VERSMICGYLNLSSAMASETAGLPELAAVIVLEGQDCGPSEFVKAREGQPNSVSATAYKEYFSGVQGRSPGRWLG